MGAVVEPQPGPGLGPWVESCSRGFNTPLNEEAQASRTGLADPAKVQGAACLSPRDSQQLGPRPLAAAWTHSLHSSKFPCSLFSQLAWARSGRLWPEPAIGKYLFTHYSNPALAMKSALIPSWKKNVNKH